MVGKLYLANKTLKQVTRRLGSSWSSYNREVLLKDSFENLVNSTINVVIDVGCADGSCTSYIQQLLNAKLVVGLDISREELDLAMIHNPKHTLYVCADAHAMPFQNQSFDIVFAKDLLHHVNDPLKVLDEFKRVLKPKGHLIIIEPRRGNFLMDIYLKYGHNHFALPKLLGLLKKQQIRRFYVKGVTAFPHHLLFWSGKAYEILWNAFILVFLFAANLSSFFRSFSLKLLRSLIPLSYYVIIWRVEN